MFSILNEMSDPAPAKTLGVVTASIGTAAITYAVVAITGYLSFGDNVNGNVVSMCKDSAKSGLKLLLTMPQIHHQQLRRSAKQPSWFLSCSPTRYKSTHVEPQSMLCSTTASGALHQATPPHIATATPLPLRDLSYVLPALRATPAARTTPHHPSPMGSPKLDLRLSRLSSSFSATLSP